jgi:hypothetical protein
MNFTTLIIPEKQLQRNADCFVKPCINHNVTDAFEQYFVQSDTEKQNASDPLMLKKYYSLRETLNGEVDSLNSAITMFKEGTVKPDICITQRDSMITLLHDLNIEDYLSCSKIIMEPRADGYRCHIIVIVDATRSIISDYNKLLEIQKPNYNDCIKLRKVIQKSITNLQILKEFYYKYMNKEKFPGLRINKDKQLCVVKSPQPTIIAKRVPIFISIERKKYKQLLEELNVQKLKLNTLLLEFKTTCILRLAKKKTQLSNNLFILYNATSKEIQHCQIIFAPGRVCHVDYHIFYLMSCYKDFIKSAYFNKVGRTSDLSCKSTLTDAEQCAQLIENTPRIKFGIQNMKIACDCYTDTINILNKLTCPIT